MRRLLQFHRQTSKKRVGASDCEVGGELDEIHEEKGYKSERRMPRLLEARKDVVSCDKARGSANRN